MISKYITKLQKSKQYGINRDSPTDQWNRTEGLEINPHTHSELILNKRAKNTQRGKDSLQQILGKLDIYMQKSEIDTCLTTYTEINSTQIETWNYKTPRRKHRGKAL